MTTAIAGLILFLLVVGIILWVFPVTEQIQKMIIGLLLIVVLLWLARFVFGVSLPGRL